MKQKWTKFDEFKYNFRRNFVVVLMVLLFCGLVAVVIDEKVHDGFVQATLLSEGFIQSPTGANRVVSAALENGTVVRIDFPASDPVSDGRLVKLDKRTGQIFGANRYSFVEYID